ncbi:MAG: TIM barrel protein [Faecalibacterium sp.]
MNKIGITQWMQPLPLAELAPLAKEHGFTGIGLPFNADYKENSVFCPAVREQALDLQRQYGMSYPSMGMNIFCEVRLCVPENFDLACAILADAVSAAKATGVPILQVPAFYASRIYTAEDLANTAAVFRAACLAAQADDVMITSENALTTEENLQLVKAVNCHNFALYFDTQNPVSFAGYNATEQVAPLLPYIAQLHLKDGDDSGASLLGKGNTDFFKTAAAFKAGGYEGWMLSETNYNQLLKESGQSLEALLAADAATIAAIF